MNQNMSNGEVWSRSHLRSSLVEAKAEEVALGFRPMLSFYQGQNRSQYALIVKREG